MNNKITYFPQTRDEIEEYVVSILDYSLKNDYESEKLLLFSIINLLFDTPQQFDVCPQALLFLLQSTAMEDNNGRSILDNVFITLQENGISDNYIDVYWYLKASGVVPKSAMRLISIYQFYDMIFKDVVISDDGKTFMHYPKSKKDDTYIIPEGVENVAPHAFSKNKYITTIKIPKTLKTINKTSFVILPSLKNFVVSKDNPVFYSEYGILYGKSGTKPSLVKFPPANKCSFIHIPAKIGKIKSFAFDNCQNIKELALETGKTVLEDNAFANCLNLKTVTVFDKNKDMLNQNAFLGIELSNYNETDKDIEETKNLQQENVTETEDETIDNENAKSEQKADTDTLTPSSIMKMFNDYIVGHDEAKKTLSVAVYSHILRCKNKNSGIGKSNILLCGPTGCGKTEFARTIAKCLNVPFVTADATSITETGMKGSDPTDMLKDLLIASNNNLSQAQNGIIYIDEIDKLASYGENAYRESYSKGVQQGLLKIIEGGVIPIRIENNMQQGTINFDTSNVLFIVGGAFGSMTSENADTKNKVIGFNSSEKQENKSIQENLQAKDFVKYGMTQEFIGRFPVIIQLKQLSENDIYRIMVEPKNSVITQYKNLVKCIGAELDFDDELLKYISKDAFNKGTGARGIRSVIEKLVENVIFELPDKDGVKKVIIHKGMLINKEPPKYIS